jgi:hypothetical protein
VFPLCLRSARMGASRSSTHRREENGENFKSHISTGTVLGPVHTKPISWRNRKSLVRHHPTPRPSSQWLLSPRSLTLECVLQRFYRSTRFRLTVLPISASCGRGFTTERK